MEICGIEESIEYLKNYKYDNEVKQAIETLLTAYEKEKGENKRLRKCHFQYEEMTGIDLLLPEKEE